MAGVRVSLVRRNGSNPPAWAWWLLLVVWPLLFRLSPAAAQPVDLPLAARLQQLEPYLDRYPPELSGDQQRRSVLSTYQALKAELDVQVAAHPTDPALLYLRGRLQRFGHNLDQPGTWLGATHDLRAVLTINPWHVPALLDLGTLWVHSWPALAPNAEALLRTAQCYHGSQPLEVAQRGVFFALYFQGKVREAARQADYLQRTWPGRDEYARLQEMVLSVLARQDRDAGTSPAPADSNPPVMASCESPAQH
jgi:hypothetical protein